MTTTQTHVEIFLAVFSCVMWLIIGNWILFMLIRVLRWTYLEKKAIHRPSRRWSPPEPTFKDVYRP
jgi:hypothetical protein